MQNTGVMTVTPARKTLQFEKAARTPLSERSISDNENNDDENDKENKMHRAFGAAFFCTWRSKGKLKKSKRRNKRGREGRKTDESIVENGANGTRVSASESGNCTLERKKNNPPKQRNTNKSVGELKITSLVTVTTGVTNAFTFSARRGETRSGKS